MVDQKTAKYTGPGSEGKTSNLKHILDVLDMINESCPHSHFKYLRTHGRSFDSIEPSKIEDKFLRSCLNRYNTKVKRCFYNSQSICIGNDDIKLYEGYATYIIPVYHSWCVYKDSILLDPTWPLDFKDNSFKNNRVIGLIPDNWAYFGVPIDKKLVFKSWNDFRSAAPILERFSNIFNASG